MSERNYCVKCFKLQSEAAGEKCGNPIWHDGQPNQPVVEQPPESPRLPYSDPEEVVD